jgi:hypothetical protein
MMQPVSRTSTRSQTQCDGHCNRKALTLLEELLEGFHPREEPR